jgi:hypothetical protein
MIPLRRNSVLQLIAGRETFGFCQAKSVTEQYHLLDDAAQKLTLPECTLINLGSVRIAEQKVLLFQPLSHLIGLTGGAAKKTAKFSEQASNLLILNMSGLAV